MKERIKQLRKALSLTQSDFATNLHVTRSTVGIWETIDDRPPSSVTVALICEIYNVNRRWLETGEGEMFADKSEIEEITDFMADLSNPTDDEELQQAKRDFIKAIARLSPEEWKVLTKIAKDWQGK